MKKVFTSSSDVIHLFAQRSQDEARCSNVYFYDIDKIYSYGRHYLLGQFITNKKGDTAIIINNEGYSNTTAKHISEITGATRQYKQFFKKQIDLQLVYNEIDSNLIKLQTARKKELYIDPSKYLFEKLNDYILWTGKTEIKKTDLYKKIVKAIKLINSDKLNDYLKKEQNRIKADKEKAEKQRIKNLQIQIEKFENYEIRYISGTEEDFLRLSPDGEFVETSQGVNVTTKEAKILYLMIQSKKDIKGFKIANYTVISINGTLKIGCHHININSVHKIGQLLIQNA